MIHLTNFASAKRAGLRLAILSLFLFGLVFINGVRMANAQAFTESFDTVTQSATPVPGWTGVNNSPSASTAVRPFWFQTNPNVITPQSGGAISANFNNTVGANTISNWLISPSRTFSNGDVITFYTATVAGQQFPDRLQVRLSLAGTSVNVGTTPTSVGDFTTLLLDINPNYNLTTYPEVMTKFTITLSGIATPTAGRIAFRYFVEDGGPAGNNSDTIAIDTFTYTPAGSAAPVQHFADFNGDGKTDFSVVHETDTRGGAPLQGQMRWYILDGLGGGQENDFGLATDTFLTGDFDGDKKSDIAVWRSASSAVVYIIQSATNTLRIEQFGTTNDEPVFADYDGDGRTDLAIFRRGTAVGSQSVWIYRTVSRGPDFFVPWGINGGVNSQGRDKGDFPAPGDYDGDGKADFVVQRENSNGTTSYWRRLTGGSTDIINNFGLAGDLNVPGDYDGDGKTDIAVARGDTASGQIDWYYKPSSAPAEPWRYLGRFGSFNFDDPVPGDYDGDGKTDIAVWRNLAEAPFTQSRFYVVQSTSGFRQFALGHPGDFPLASYNTY